MKNVLITGTSKGLGLELARGFLVRGFRVLGVARSSCEIEHENYRHLLADVTKDDYRQRLKALVDNNDVRHLDILVNNAGAGGMGRNIDEVRLKDIRAQFELHCVAALSTIQALRLSLEKSKIVNISSRLGSMHFNQRGDFTGRGFSYSYRIAKGAQNMLSLCLLADEELSGNLIISLIPGLLRTDSGAADAKHSAAEGGEAVLETILKASDSGIYHAFEDEAAY